MIVGDGARAEFQGWEVRYEVGRSVTASRASGRKGHAGYKGGDRHIAEWRTDRYSLASCEEARKLQATQEGDEG